MYKHRYTQGHTQGVQMGVHQERYRTEETRRTLLDPLNNPDEILILFVKHVKHHSILHDL